MPRSGFSPDGEKWYPPPLKYDSSGGGDVSGNDTPLMVSSDNPLKVDTFKPKMVSS